jgi:HSP20 family protein
MVQRHGAFRDFDQLTARVFDSATRRSGARLEAYRDDDTIHLDIDLPSAGPAGVDFAVDGEGLTVRAERRRTGREGPAPVAAEGEAGEFTRRILLSERLDTDRLEARYDGGMLTVRIPVAESTTLREIEIVPGDQGLAFAA